MKNTQMKYYLLLSALLLSRIALASHMTGGNMTYKLLNTSGTMNTYAVTMTLYADCLNGSPDAVMQDNPAYFGVYKQGSVTPIQMDTAVYYSSSSVVPTTLVSPCQSVSGSYCILKKEFTASFTLPASTVPYTVVYQRCCLATTDVNLSEPENKGFTISCTIPPAANNSAVFKIDPQRIVCLNKPCSMDLSATDTDHDSLSYEFTAPLNGGGPTAVKPLPGPPPFDSLMYSFPATSQNQMGLTTPLVLDPRTGVLSGTPTKTGIYQMSINCLEWRGGVLINKTMQVFQIIVANCGTSAEATTGYDITAVKGSRIQLNAAGGLTYKWLTTTNLSDSTIGNPYVNLPETGTFKYLVTLTTASGCILTDTIVITVIENSEVKMPNVFTPNGDGKNDLFQPLFVGGCEVQSIKIFNRWGNKVYDGVDGWDGKHNGMLLESGIYVWELVYKNDVSEVKTIKGNVMLMR